MRRAFFETLARLGREDERVLLLTADLGFRAIEPFATRCPDQFFNVGVCEQNMVGMATGLAEAGFLPFVYSIAPFAVLRPYEFIRNGPVAHRLPVRIIGVGSGLEYGTNGISHYAIEDIGVLRVMPGLTLIAPADTFQAAAALEGIWDMPAPFYFRLSKNEEAPMPELGPRFALGRTQTLRTGADVILVGLGTAVRDALAAAAQLEEKGVSAHVELVDNLNFGPLEGLGDKLSHFPLAAAIEAHSIHGGLGSMLCETVAERGLPCRVLRCGISAFPDGHTGSEAYLRARHGISGDAVAARVLAALRVGHEA